MSLTSARETQLWWWAVVAQVAIYISLAFVRVPAEWLRERGLLGTTIAVLFSIAAVWVVLLVVRRRPTVAELLTLVVFGVIYVVVLLQYDRVEERAHFLQYGIVGGLVVSALLERRGNLQEAGQPLGWWTRWPSIAAVLITSAAGWGDEGIQAILPSRVYELRDVAMNVLAGILAISGLGALRWARARDRRRAEEKV